MIQKQFSTIFILSLLLVVVGCNKNEKKENFSTSLKQIENSLVVLDSNSTEKIEPTETFLDTFSKTSIQNVDKKEATPKITKQNVIAVDYPMYTNLKTILSSFKIGETQTKEELITAHLIPEEALKIVKSVTKVAENELTIEWKSTWLIEKFSDVEFQDGNIKLEFKDDLIYTSGEAIGIKYDGKVYTDLKIKKNKAYIKSVKEYSWKIGK